MFAPDHRRAADEITRVVRPGGRIAIASWTPEGSIGDFFRTVSKHAPPPPGDSPLLWGTEDHLRELFPESVLSFERQAVRFDFGSAQAAAEFYFVNFGPIVMARARAADEARAARRPARDVRRARRRRRPLPGRVPHGGGEDMISIVCPAGSRTVHRGASQTSSASRTVNPASLNASTTPLVVGRDDGDVALARDHRLVLREQVDLRALALDPRRARLQSRRLGRPLEAEQRPERHALVDDVRGRPRARRAGASGHRDRFLRPLDRAPHVRAQRGELRQFLRRDLVARAAGAARRAPPARSSATRSARRSGRSGRRTRRCRA